MKIVGISFVLYETHNNASFFEAIEWDWSNRAVNDDAMFIHVLYKFYLVQ